MEQVNDSYIFHIYHIFHFNRKNSSTMKYILLPVFALCLATCTNTSSSESGKKQETEWASQQPKAPTQVEVTKFKTKSGKEFTVVEKKLSASLSRITVQASGFPNSHEIYSLKDVDPMQIGLQADLDGSGSHASIYGFASYKDLSYGQIYIPEPAEGDINFSGYMGHDKISILGNRLLREFPVFNTGDPNSSPSGGSRVLKYALEAGEASYTLTVKEVTTHR
jgi:hypothetical protein